VKKLLVILICGTLVILSIVGVASWLSWQPQSWYVPTSTPSQDVADLAERAEYRLNEEFHKIRPPIEVWKIRITDEIMNAWLATRLDGWLTHDQEVELPPEVHNLQTHTTVDGIWLAAMIEIDESDPRPLAILLNAWIKNGELFTQTEAIRLGKIPIPVSIFESVLSELEKNTVGMAAIAPLMDDREVVIRSIDFEEGAIVLTCQTRLPE
jgi:hypothetical protein